MQSFLQFRRTGLAVQQQIDRDLERAQRRIRRDRQTGTEDDETKNEATMDPPNTLLEKGDKPHISESRREDPISQGSDQSSTVEEANDDDIEECSPNLHTVATARTQYTERTALGQTLTGVRVRDRRTNEGKDGQVFVVDWEGPEDPLNPRNWPLTRRIGVTLQISLIAAVVGSASGIDATVLPQAAAGLQVSDVAESLATGLFLVGMGVGSLVAGPFSETFGRNAVYVGSMANFMIWIMASGLAPNFGAQIVFRFLAGCASSTPLVCSGGSISDLFNSIEKTWAFPLYAVAGFGGPMLGAVMGAYIGPSTLSWRWCEWVTLILGGVVVILLLLFLPETYGPLLLKWKAEHLRRITNDERYRAEHEIVSATLISRLKVSITRPFLMLTEPIIIAMATYLTLVYIVLFTFLVGWPKIFEEPYGIGQGLAHITFLSMAVGTWLSFLLAIPVWHITMKQVRLAESQGKGQQFNPEVRLLYAMFGPSIAIPVALYWMAWTASPQVSIWSPTIAAALFGFGTTGVFIFAYMYVIDAYEVYSASALTFVALTRYVVAGGMTVVGTPFYNNMGVHYTITILASLSLILVPIPYVLYKYGYWLRKRSKYAVSREI